MCVYIVGVYRPPGNLVGFFEENVDKGTFDKEKYCEEGEDDSDDDDSEQETEEGDSRDKDDDADQSEKEEDVDQDLKVQVAVKDKTGKVEKNSKQSNKSIRTKKNE